LLLQRTGAITGSYRIAVGGANNNLYIQDAAQSADRLVINSDGNVGIGLTSPSSVLDIASNNSGMTITNTGASNKKWRVGGGSGGTFQITEAGVADRLTIDTSGNVGIGTSSPDGSARLDVQGGRTYLAASSSGLNLYLRYNTSTAGVFLGSPSADAFTIYNSAGTERMRIDSSGNVGIGTSAPSARLHILTASDETIRLATSTTNPYLSFYESTSRRAYIQYAAGGGGLIIDSEVAGTGVILSTQNTERMRIASNGNVAIGTTNASRKLVVNGGSSDAYIQTTTTATTSAGSAGIMFQTGSSNFDYSNMIVVAGGTNAMQFWTADSERMRIDSSGSVLIGGTSSPATTKLLAKGATTSSEGITVQETTGGASTRFLVGFYNSSGTKTGDITTNGTTTAYGTSSDYRLKENIAPMTGALAKVAALKPVTYNWKADGSSGQGFIAHELQAVVPDCVTGEKDAVDKDGKPVYQGIDTSFLVATLTAAIQEQQALITSLTARIAALESK
jgi:hypothetical protein